MKSKITTLLEESPKGLTSKYLAVALNCPRGKIHKELVEMKRSGEIVGTGEYRRGAAVVVLAGQRAFNLPHGLQSDPQPAALVQP